MIHGISFGGGSQPGAVFCIHAYGVPSMNHI